MVTVNKYRSLSEGFLSANHSEVESMPDLFAKERGQQWID